MERSVIPTEDSTRYLIRGKGQSLSPFFYAAFFCRSEVQLGQRRALMGIDR